MITDYLLAVDRELQLGRRRRARVLAEVEDHLLSAAAELRADGLAVAEAEARAITAFGDPGELARELNDVEARRHVVRTGRLALPLGLAGGWLGLRGIVGLGAPLPVALAGFVLAQVALVAGGLTGMRAWRARRGGDPAVLVFVRRGSALVTGCGLALIAGAELTAARHGTRLTPLALALGAVSLILLGVGCWALRRGGPARRPLPVPEDHDVLTELAPLVGRATVARVERWISPCRRPGRFAWVISALAGAALAAGHGLAEGGPPDLAGLPRALLAGLILGGTETLAALAGFLVLGRWLGLRPARD